MYNQTLNICIIIRIEYSEMSSGMWGNLVYCTVLGMSLRGANRFIWSVDDTDHISIISYRFILFLQTVLINTTIVKEFTYTCFILSSNISWLFKLQDRLKRICIYYSYSTVAWLPICCKLFNGCCIFHMVSYVNIMVSSSNTWIQS